MLHSNASGGESHYHMQQGAAMPIQGLRSCMGTLRELQLMQKLTGADDERVRQLEAIHDDAQIRAALDRAIYLRHDSAAETGGTRDMYSCLTTS